MRVDIYRRAEAGEQFSYLIVPEGKPLPEEVTNVDWETEDQGRPLDGNALQLRDYGIDDPARQIEEKGYAITGVKHLQDH
jgi:hypothetical protein